MVILIISRQNAATEKQALLLCPRRGLININHYPRMGVMAEGVFQMKNTIKVFGTHSRILCAIALIAVLGFSMTGCDTNPGDSNDDDSSGGSNPEKIRLTNVSVTVQGAAPTSNNFVLCHHEFAVPSDSILTDVITGTPKAQMTNSKLTLELDKPKDEAMVLVDSDSFFNGGPTITPAATVKFYRIIHFKTSDNCQLWLCAPPNTNTWLFYVENDVKVNGANSFYSFTNVTLKKGWNYVSLTGTTQPYVITASQTQPAGSVWITEK